MRTISQEAQLRINRGGEIPVSDSVEAETTLGQEGQDGGRHRASVKVSGIEVYIAVKLRTLVPWSDGSCAYQHVFAEAYRLCQGGSDFNLIYREPEGRFVRLFTQQSTPRSPAWLSAFNLRPWGKKRRETIQWRQRLGIVEMRPGGQLWVQEKPAWYRVVREGSLNPDQLKKRPYLGRHRRALWWLSGGIGLGLMMYVLSAWL
jgi:hypothetical protein